MAIKHCNLMKNAESDNLLILTDQNFSGLEHNSLKMARVNQHVLCFTEHHVAKLNLCLTSLENYSLGSRFSCSIYQKDDTCIFVIKDICYSSFDISIYCAIQLTVQAKHLKIICMYIYIYIYMCVCVCVYKFP
jgi:hypothetical protein